MKTILIAILLVLSINTAKSQLQGQAKLDSLLKELPKMKEDTNGVKFLLNICREYYTINPNELLIYGTKGLKLANKIKWELGIADFNNLFGVYHLGKTEYDISLEFFLKSLKINEDIGNIEGVAKNLGNLANIYGAQSNHSKALEYSHRALKINKEIGNKLFIEKNYQTIGSIYAKQSNYSKALEYFLKALKIDEEVGNTKGVATNLRNIGYIYQSQSDFPKALESLLKSQKISIEIGDIRGAAYTQANIGSMYGTQMEYPKALEYYHKSVNSLEQIGDEYGSVAILGNIGSIYGAQSNYTKALEHLYKALDISKKLGIKEGIALNLGNIGGLYLRQAEDSTIENNENKMELLLNKETHLNKAIEYSIKAINKYKEIGELHFQSNNLANLSKAYQLKGNYKKALEAKEESYKLKDSIFNKENNDKISALEKSREDDVNKLKIEKQEIQLQAQEDERQLIILSAVGALLSVLLILTVIINQRRKSEKLLLNVLPEKIAKRLKAKEHPIADHFDNASIIFIDLVGFTKMSSNANPKEIVSLLNDIFTIFDKLADKHGLEKIKTIGDAYMAVAGVPEIQSDHAKRTAQMALDIKSEMKDFKTSNGTEIKFRIGIDCGAVVAGVIGEKKFIYDLWSDAVNTASRMESTGESGQIQITDNFKTELEKFDGNWNFTLRGEFEIKGKGLMKTYFLEENNLGEL